MTAIKEQSLRGASASHFSFLLLLTLSVVAFWKPLEPLFRFSFGTDTASQIAFMPLVTLYLVYLDRKIIFRGIRPAYRAGGALVIAGIVLYWVAARLSKGLNLNDSLSAKTLPIVIVWFGIFLFCYGPRVLRVAAFPLAFLLLMVPIPTFVLNRSIYFLQEGSTDLSAGLFQLLGIPVLRTGFVLTLPSVTIEVAKECSSIRSSLALMITCLLASCLFLRTASTRAILVLLALPLSLVKNGIRIVTLCLLSIYVNPGFLHGRLHHEGGIVFFLIALLIMAPILFLLQKVERKPKGFLSSSRTSEGQLEPESHNQGAGTIAST